MRKEKGHESHISNPLERVFSRRRGGVSNRFKNQTTRLWLKEFDWFSEIKPGAEYYEAPEDSGELRDMHYTFLSALAGDYARRFRTMHAEIRGCIDASGKSFRIRISGGELRDVSL